MAVACGVRTTTLHLGHGKKSFRLLEQYSQQINSTQLSFSSSSVGCNTATAAADASDSTALNKEESSATTKRPAFNTQPILALKPFPAWLQGEMRSNHAGETGAVQIYAGCLWALDLRKSLGLSYGPATNIGNGDNQNGTEKVRKELYKSYEDELRVFSLEHRDNEQNHIDLLEEVLLHNDADKNSVSKLLPAWKWAGFTLGAVSTAFCPRGMYLTTKAVETFVEEHYMDQIRRLRYESAQEIVSLAEAKKEAVEVTNATHTSSSDPCIRAATEGKKQLIALLEHCCQDEVHHKEEASDRAAVGPFPWFDWVDTGWMAFVRKGSSIAADFAKRI